MELDNIKKLWTEIDALKDKQHINEERIKELLKSNQKTALSRLIWLEKFQLIVIAPFCVLFYVFFREMVDIGGLYTTWLLVFLLLTVAGVFIVFRKYRMLKNIDVSNMIVKDIFAKISNYQRIVQKEKILAAVLVFVLLAAFFVIDYRHLFGSEIVWSQIIFGIVVILAATVFTPFLYKKLYHKHIEQIKQSLKELEEFEEN